MRNVKLESLLGRLILATLRGHATSADRCVQDLEDYVEELRVDKEELEAAKAWCDAYQEVDSYLLERMPKDYTLPHEQGTDKEMVANTISMIQRLWGEASLGVGDGSGKLFVHGSHEAIKRVQDMIFELETLRKERRGST